MLTKRDYAIIQLEKTDSTSSYISRELHNLENLSVIVAQEQSEGRGQNGHRWLSSPGENLLFSILIKYDADHVMPAIRQTILTMASSMAVIDFLSYGFGISASIKKPNDIYVDGKKICGMLIENGVKGGMMEWSIIGIGINVNQTLFPANLPNPVSIAQITGKKENTKKCLKEFLRHFTARFDAIWEESETLERDYLEKVISLRQ